MGPDGRILRLTRIFDDTQNCLNQSNTAFVRAVEAIEQSTAFNDKAREFLANAHEHLREIEQGQSQKS